MYFSVILRHLATNVRSPIIIIIDNQQASNILIYLFLNSSTCFGLCFRPSSGAFHCNYSFYYCPPMFLLARVLIMFHPKGLKSVPPNTQHQPAATSMDNTRSCSYSDMLLMMGENNARKMWSCLEINKSK